MNLLQNKEVIYQYARIINMKKLKLFLKFSISLIGVLSNHQTKLNIVLEVTSISEVFFYLSKKFDIVNHDL